MPSCLLRRPPPPRPLLRERRARDEVPPFQSGPDGWNEILGKMRLGDIAQRTGFLRRVEQLTLVMSRHVDDRHLRPALIKALVPDAAIRKLIPPGDTESLLDRLQTLETRADLLDRALAAAWATCRTLMGEDASAWAWGRLHRALFAHPLSALGGGVAVWRSSPSEEDPPPWHDRTIRRNLGRPRPRTSPALAA